MKANGVSTGYTPKLVGILVATQASLTALESQQQQLERYYDELEQLDPHLADLCREADSSMIEPLNRLLRYVQTKKEVAFAAPS